MEANLELGLRHSTSQLTTKTDPGAAWHVLGLLLSQGHPASPSDLAFIFAHFFPNPEFIRFLCSIPNSPLRFVDNHFITFSPVGVAAIAQFFANSDLIPRYLDLQHSVPRLLANFGSNGIVRMYCRKRKRPILEEVEDFPLMKKKSYFPDFYEERNPNQMMMTMPSGIQSAYTLGNETLSSLSPLMEYDCWKKIMFRPLTFCKSRSAGQLSYEIENVGPERNDIPNTERLGCLHGDNFNSFIPRIVPEEILINSAPLPKLSHPPCILSNSEGKSRNSDIDNVNPVENRRRASSIHKNIEQKTFPDFESFIVEEEEGSGGYGTVYRARRKADGVIFAIKCPHVNANRNYVTNEIKMLERLGGKNFVIKYEGSFKSANADFLVLEHVKHDRPEILKREMNVTDLQWYGYCLFKALAGLHKQGIVHRDIKPGNFLYSRKVHKGYLIDFNLALDMHKKYRTSDSSKARHSLNDPFAVPQIKSLPPAKSRKLMNATFVDKKGGKVSKSVLPPGNLKKEVDRAKHFPDGSRNIIKSQGADGSGITSAKDATSTRTLSAERFREPLPSQGRKALLSLVQEAMQGGNHEYINSPKSKRKRVAAPAAAAGDADTRFFYTTPMPLHANGIALRGAGLLKSSKGDGKHRREGPCVGTKGFKAPEVLFRSLHQGPNADIWSAGVTLLYLMIGKSPFVGDAHQNIKEIAKLRGSEELWEVAKLHNNEALFPMDLLDVKYLSPMNLRDWCGRNTRRRDIFEAMPASLFDLMDKCLTVNPRKRISAEEALRHDFFSPCYEAFRKYRSPRSHKK